MKKRHARIIRAAILHARAMRKQYAFMDAFSRGMWYRSSHPKNELAGRAYRRTWWNIEVKIAERGTSNV